MINFLLSLIGVFTASYLGVSWVLLWVAIGIFVWLALALAVGIIMARFGWD